jgi:predicted RNase H-like nuclease
VRLNLLRRRAEGVILKWQEECRPTATIVLIDQPTIVNNPTGQRPVENIVSSPISRRYGGIQPANSGREEMFGAEAPIWPFLRRFGGPENPLKPVADTRVFETYPVLALIELGWRKTHKMRNRVFRQLCQLGKAALWVSCELLPRTL